MILPFYLINSEYLNHIHDFLLSNLDFLSYI